MLGILLFWNPITILLIREFLYFEIKVLSVGFSICICMSLWNVVVVNENILICVTLPPINRTGTALFSTVPNECFLGYCLFSLVVSA